MQDHYHVARKRIVNEQLIPAGVRDDRLLDAVSRVPRHRFVEKGLAEQAYLDRPLTIGHGQTISQPLIVGLMTNALKLSPTDRVLEIGTGCGYQTAILAELVKEVYTVERLQALSIKARKNLYRLSYKNIHFKVGDGTLGWEEHAPYDAIVATAGGPKVPEALISQLKEGARLVIPVGTEQSQQLYLIQKKQKQTESTVLCDCRFVKMIGQHGWKE